MQKITCEGLDKDLYLGGLPRQTERFEVDAQCFVHTQPLELE